MPRTIGIRTLNKTHFSCGNRVNHPRLCLVLALTRQTQSSTPCLSLTQSSSPGKQTAQICADQLQNITEVTRQGGAELLSDDGEEALTIHAVGVAAFRAVNQLD